MISKVGNKLSDESVSGTSVATAVMAATSTIILRRLLKISEHRRKDKFEHSDILKKFIQEHSDPFDCTKNGLRTNLIFNIGRCIGLRLDMRRR